MQHYLIMWLLHPWKEWNSCSIIKWNGSYMRVKKRNKIRKKTDLKKKDCQLTIQLPIESYYGIWRPERFLYDFCKPYSLTVLMYTQDKSLNKRSYPKLLRILFCYSTLASESETDPTCYLLNSRGIFHYFITDWGSLLVKMKSDVIIGSGSHCFAFLPIQFCNVWDGLQMMRFMSRCFLQQVITERSPLLCCWHSRSLVNQLVSMLCIEQCYFLQGKSYVYLHGQFEADWVTKWL